MLYKDAIKEFVFECHCKNISERTIRKYSQNVKGTFVYLEKEYDINEEEITHQHIKLYFNYLKLRKCKETYINSILKSLRAFYKFCLHEDYVSTNPCLKVSWVKETNPIIQTFTNEEVMKMLNAFDYTNYLNARNKVIVATLIDTGIRNLELCMLQKKNVNDTNMLIDGKGNKQRYVPISPSLRKMMMKYERVRDFYFKDKLLDHDCYFLSRTGRPLTDETVERTIRDAAIIAKVRKEIRSSPHTCRHFFSQTQLKNGLDVYSLSRLLGHENITITKRYLQSMQDEQILDMSIKTSPLMNLRK